MHSSITHSSTMPAALEGAPVRLEYQSMSFSDLGSSVRFTLLNLFFVDVPKQELQKIGNVTVFEHALEFSSPSSLSPVSKSSAERKFNFLLAKYMASLKNRISGNPTISIHQQSGIPLIGNLYFGIVDKGSTLIELKPLTSCNANCVFCSVDEGPSSKMKLDYVVEKDYLVTELDKLLAIKDKPMTVYLNPQGDPTLYTDLVGLVQDVSAMPKVKETILITNGLLLSPLLVEKLFAAGLTRAHVSLSAIDPEIAKQVMGSKGYNVDRVKENIEQIAKAHGPDSVLLTPVVVPGMNENELPKLIAFAKHIGCTKIGVQNFMTNPRGRNPVKPLPLDVFKKKMQGLEKEYGIQLLEDYRLEATPELPKPFKRDDVVHAQIMCPGRYPGEKIAASHDRNILIPQCDSEGKVLVKIRKSLHNIYVGEAIRNRC